MSELVRIISCANAFAWFREDRYKRSNTNQYQRLLTCVANIKEKKKDRYIKYVTHFLSSRNIKTPFASRNHHSISQSIFTTQTTTTLFHTTLHLTTHQTMLSCRLHLSRVIVELKKHALSISFIKIPAFKFISSSLYVKLYLSYV